MAAKSVRIHEVSKVAPFFYHNSTTSTSIKTLPLTYLDTYWFNISPVDQLHFYEILGLTRDSFSSQIVPKLKRSLSLTLLHYLPISGHLMWPPGAPKPAVYYNNNNNTDGVSFTVAESTSDADSFHHLSGNGSRKAVESHPLVPQLAISDEKAELLAVQVTLFPNQGFSIAFSVHHTVFDGRSTILFLKSWAYLSKQLNDDVFVPEFLPEELTPSFDRTLVKDPTGIDMVYVKHMMDFAGMSPNTRSLKVIPDSDVGPDMVRRTFGLTRQDLNNLRIKLLSLVNQESEQQQLGLSSFVLTCAHVFVCLVKAKARDANETVSFWVTADCRGHLNLPERVNYFGNCVVAEFAVAKASDFTKEDGVAFVAGKICELIRRLKRGDAVGGSEERMVAELEAIKETGERSMLTVAGSTRGDFYGSDFGWGKPKKADVPSIDRTGAISLMASSDGAGGVEIGVVLKEPQMEVFASLFVDGLHEHDDQNSPTKARS